MTKLVLTFLTAAAFTGSALAASTAQEMRFTRDGISYVANVSDRAGVRYISGYERASGRRFDLRIARGFVTGTFDGSPVAYPAVTGTATASR